jgi:hypothetical protein
LASPEYSARKHHMPAPPGVNDADVAAPPLNVTALPTGLPPPPAQPLAVVKGPHSKKFTIPVGAGPPALPVTVAVSVFETPRMTVEAVGVVFVVELAAVTVKHSALPPSEEPV